jgi:hypothetical protein
VLVSELKTDPATPGHYEYYAGVNSGAPMWSTTRANAAPVFTDRNSAAGAGTFLGVVYDAPLKRYIAAEGHGISAGQMGYFEAPQPWGPWATIAYYDDWGGFNETAGEAVGLQFPSKWISSDGKTLWAAFSGTNHGSGPTEDFDSLNVIQALLSTSGSGNDPAVVISHVSSGESYSLTTAKVGAFAYIDRDYKLTSLSSSLAGGLLVQSANGDKAITTSDYLQLKLVKAATLAVCYSDVHALPAWLDDT